MQISIVKTMLLVSLLYVVTYTPLFAIGTHQYTARRGFLCTHRSPTRQASIRPKHCDGHQTLPFRSSSSFLSHQPLFATSVRKNTGGQINPRDNVFIVTMVREVTLGLIMN